jgi:tRNA(fMet)-specific endonuclease VapC
MSFLLDTDTCSYHVKRPSGLMHRFQQYSGNLFISTLTLGELYVWAYQRVDPSKILRSLESDLLPGVLILDYDNQAAVLFGRYRGELLRKGIDVPPTDMINASVALLHNLTLVTHNTRDYQAIPGLRLDDWLIP